MALCAEHTRVLHILDTIDTDGCVLLHVFMGVHTCETRCVDLRGQSRALVLKSHLHLA